jgi:hypothetical protein
MRVSPLAWADLGEGIAASATEAGYSGHAPKPAQAAGEAEVGWWVSD